MLGIDADDDRYCYCCRFWCRPLAGAAGARARRKRVPDVREAVALLARAGQPGRWPAMLFGRERASCSVAWARFGLDVHAAALPFQRASSCWRRPGFALPGRAVLAGVHGATGSIPDQFYAYLLFSLALANGAVLADNLVAAALLLGRAAADAVRHDRHRPAGRVQDRDQGVHHRRHHRPVHDVRHRPDGLAGAAR